MLPGGSVVQNRYGPQAWETFEIDEHPFAPPVFGGNLVEIMDRQKQSDGPSASMAIPEALYVLAKAINELGGHTSEGIFRIPGKPVILYLE